MWRATTMITIAICLLAVNVQAAYVKEKAKGSVRYSGLLKFQPSAEDRMAATKDAKAKALQKYFSGLDQARLKLLEPLMPEILADLDRFVPECDVIADQMLKEMKTYEVTVEAAIDESQVERLIAAKTTTSQAAVSEEEEMIISIVFVAREAATVRKFQDRVINKAVEEDASTVKESGGATGDGSYAGGHSAVKETTVTTGGSTLKQADEIQHRVTTVTEVDAKLQEVFAKADIVLAAAGDIEVDVESFMNDFSVGNDVSPATRRAAFAKCREAGVHFLAVGTMDVGMQDTDPATGMQRVYVTITAKVTDLRKKVPTTLASVGPTQYAGLGPDAQVARINALVEAAGNASQDMVDQIRAKSRK